MKKSKMYVVMLLAVMVVSALVGCGMKNSNGEDMDCLLYTSQLIYLILSWLCCQKYK